MNAIGPVGGGPFTAVPCRVCDGEQVEIVLDLGAQPHCNSLLVPEALGRAELHYPLRLGFCHDRTAVQIDHTVPKEEMFSKYLCVSGTTATLRAHFHLERMRDYIPGGEAFIVPVAEPYVSDRTNYYRLASAAGRPRGTLTPCS